MRGKYERSRRKDVSMIKGRESEKGKERKKEE